MKIRLFTIAFGDQFLDWFERGLIKSLCWPKNFEALRKVEAYDIWTTKRDEERAKTIASKLDLPVVTHIIGDKGKAELFPALIGQMLVSRNNAFIFAAPDCIFGDGTIKTLIEVGSVPGICVAFMPLRVNEPGFIEAMGDQPLTNAQLVTLGMSRAHRGFTDADATKPKSNSLESAISWRKIGDGLYAVTGRCPSSFFMQPIKQDIKWMQDRPKFGNYDHQFAGTLVEAQRQRVVGSSDAAFVVEITPLHIGVAALTDTNPLEPDRFWQTLPHYAVNRNVLCIWRAG